MRQHAGRLSRAMGLLAAIALVAMVSAPAMAAMSWTASEVSKNSTNYYSNLTLPAADLTTLGTADWAYWTRSGNSIVEANSKDGGQGIGALSASFNSDGDAVATGKYTAKFNFTNGTSPTSGTDVDSGAAWTRSDWNANSAISNKIPVFSFTVDAGTTAKTMNVWFAALKVANVRLTAFDSTGTQVGSAVDIAVGTGNSAAFCYKYEFGGSASGSGAITFKFEGVGPNADDSALEMQAAALVPEPATMALLGLGGVGALLRRRR